MRASLLSQFTALIALMGVLVLTASSITASLFLSDTFVDTVKTAEENYLLLQSSNVSALLRQYSNQLYAVAVDSDLASMAQQINEKPQSEQPFLMRSIREYLEKSISTTDVFAATLVSNEGRFVSYSRLQDTQSWESWFSPTGADGYNEALYSLCDRAAKAQKAVAGVTPQRYMSNNVRLFHLACPIYNLLDRSIYGTIIYSINTAALCGVVNPSNASDDIGTGILTDREGVIVSHVDPSKAYLTFDYENGDRGQAVEDGILPENALIFRQEIDRLGFVLYRVVDQNTLLIRSRVYSVGLLLAVAFIIAVILLCIALLLRHMMRSIRALQHGIYMLSVGQHDVQVPVVDLNEIGQITIAFNHMVRQLAETHQRELEALNLQHMAEIRALENQINSHFLYNTLNTINYTAIESGSLKTSAQIKHLSNMLRYTFEKSEAVVDASREAQWLDEYLSLQKLRFGECFDYSITVDKRVAAWPMRKLIVQPFVENCILHGFEGRRFGGLLSVKFQPYDESRMRVTIRDNGTGMSPERLRELKESLNGTQDKQTISGIGLKNAYQRILAYYHGQARLIVRSWEGSGTVIVLLLPPFIPLSKKLTNPH